MKYPKTKILFTALFLGVMLFSTAQENAKTPRKGWDGWPRSLLSIGYGSTMPSSTSKDAYLLNASGVNIDVSLPFASFRKGWDGTVKGGKYVSLIIGGQYNFGGSGNPSAALPNALPIFGQTSSSVAYRGVDPRNPGFRIGGGPQVNFNFGDKFTIAPMVLFEYFSMTQKELSAVQTTEYNGQTYQKDLWTLPETKTSGLAITPKIRMYYMLTSSLGLFADASYILGPKMETQLSTLVPTGPPNQAGFYEADYVNNGTYVKGETKKTSYTALGVNVGLSYSFRCGSGQCSSSMTKANDKGWNGVAEAKKMTKADSGKQQDEESIRKGWDGTIKGGVKIGNSGGIPETASDGTTVYVVTFSNGCKRACSELWTILINGCACPGEQTNMSCPANLTPNSTATARINTKNIVYDKDGNSVVTPKDNTKN